MSPPVRTPGSAQSSARGAPPNRGGRSLPAPPFALESTRQCRDTSAVQLMSQGDRALGLAAPPPSPGLSGGRSVSGGEGRLLSSTRSPRGRREARCSRGARVLDGSGGAGSSRARRADPGRAGRCSRSQRPHGLSRRPGGQRFHCAALPLRNASGPRPAHWPRAPQPAIGPRSLFYIGRPGPIGVQHLLNMHAGHQSASAGAGPPRAVAKLGLRNCY